MSEKSIKEELRELDAQYNNYVKKYGCRNLDFETKIQKLHTRSKKLFKRGEKSN